MCVCVYIEVKTLSRIPPTARELLHLVLELKFFTSGQCNFVYFVFPLSFKNKQRAKASKQIQQKKKLHNGNTVLKKAKVFWPKNCGLLMLIVFDETVQKIPVSL